MNRMVVAEKIFTVLSLLHYMGGPIIVILSGGESEGDNSIGATSYPVIQLLFFINFAISLILLTLRWKSVLSVLRKDRFISTLLAVSLLSILWSVVPAVSIVRNIALLGSSLFGLYLASRYSLREQLQLLAWAFGIAIALSLIFAIALPKYGIMTSTHAGKWRGMFTHKNVLGKSMILSSLIFALTALNERRHQILLWSGLGLSVLLLVMSSSSSSLINFLIIAAIFWLVKIVRLPYPMMIPMMFALAIVAIVTNLWLLDNMAKLLSSFGKDASLTGRVDLWPAVLDKIGQRPWLGYGFSGFWGRDWDSECAYVWRVTGWTPPNSHNGLLDLWLDLGLLGLGVFSIGLVLSSIRGLVWVRKCRTADAMWPILYIIYFWLSNQTESALLVQNEIYWLLYVTVVLSLANLKDYMKQLPIQSVNLVKQTSKPNKSLVR
ncbi:O-antigen ligase family protein [Chamaesiphon sp. VAR_69_metabat_338]|uniref:O-antigen ligase family protein n=1 Tax=Chamaesiphon sp. VAR_69_metabat_338 TaxID=2964704 RepID=UPI00286DA854|nr:O-antigen ligase family protein [Chamaesiphon sp. VAR_69_metabat_338]